MIGRLTGMVETPDRDGVIIDVGGVGYWVLAPRQVLDGLQVGAPATLWIETHVREDHILLYGFRDRLEREWFRMLTRVQGVGTKAAIAILGVLTADALALAIAAQDRVPLTRAEGVGPKLAARILSELKDRVVAEGLAAGTGLAQAARPGMNADAATFGAAEEANGPVMGEGAAAGRMREDAISALVNLGYGRAEAFSAIQRVARGGEGDLAAGDLAGLIRQALHLLADKDQAP